MKYLIVILACIVIACGQNSSPEGRMQIKNDHLQQQIDSLKQDNKKIKDTLLKMREDIKRMK